MKSDKRIKPDSLRAECVYCTGALVYGLNGVDEWTHTSAIAYTYCTSTFEQPHPISQMIAENTAHKSNAVES